MCVVFSNTVPLRVHLRTGCPWALSWLESQTHQSRCFLSPRISPVDIRPTPSSLFARTEYSPPHPNLKPSVASPFSKKGRGPSGVLGG